MRNLLSAATLAFAAFAAGIALADRTDTVSSASVDWDSYTVTKSPDGTVRITLCGHATLADGGLSPADNDCDNAVVTGAARTAAINNGNTILTRWKTAHGL